MRTGLSVADAMTVCPVTAGPETTVVDAVVLMERFGVGSVLITRGDSLLGILTETDIVRRGVLEGHDLKLAQVSQIMTQDIITVTPGMDLYEVLLLMKDTDIRTLPVIDRGKNVGLITSKDILRLQPALFETLVDALHIREADRKLHRELIDEE